MKAFTRNETLDRIRSKVDLEDLYQEYGSFYAIAKEIGCAPKTVKFYMDKFGIDYKPISVRKYTIDDNIFSEDSERSFYWAGFLAANGSVSDNYRIYINMGKDNKSFLEKMTKAFGTNTPVKDVVIRSKTTKPYIATSLLITSKKISEDLKRFNVVPRKKQTYFIPNEILNSNFIRHFVRGWIDGLGGFYKEHEFRTSGTVHILEQICDLFERNSIAFDGAITPTTKNLGKLYIGKKQYVANIAHYLYDDSVHFMDSKKEKALTYG